jgi:hypothetical protein
MNWKPIEVVLGAGRRSEQVDKLKVDTPFLAALCLCFEPLAEGVRGLGPEEAKEAESCFRQPAMRGAALETQRGPCGKMVMLGEEVFPSSKRGVGISLHAPIATEANLEK